MGEKAKGNLIIIGGNEDKKDDCIILKKVVELSGGKQGRLVVLPTATEFPRQVSEEYQRIFKRLGMQTIEIIDLYNREQANDQQFIEKIHEATGIFFTGGDQLRITSILGGSLVAGALREAYERGTVIVGTSAGASVMSDIMIIGGKDDDTPKRCTVKMAPGMALLEEVVIDQHFAQRGRIGRLLTAVAQNPYILGIGIDEDTAIVVNPTACFEVIGSQTVTVIDGKNIIHSNVSESKPDEPLALTNITVHVLPASYCFDLRSRKPVWGERSKRTCKEDEYVCIK